MPHRQYRESSILHIEDLDHGYDGKKVLDNVDLSVKAGEFVTVVGPSGCGKSTLLRLVVGQEIATAGMMMVQGAPVSTPSAERGVVYQHYSLFPNLSALDNVLSAVRLRQHPWQSVSKEERDRAAHLLERAGLKEHTGKYPSQLSGGQRQRVAIVQSVFKHPQILCMDEPFSALDPGTREDMQMFILEIWEEEGMTILFVTHDLEEGLYLGTRLIALSRYYMDDRELADDKRGAKIVLDWELAHRAVGPSVKETAEFGQAIQNVRREAFDPQYRQHVRGFELTHSTSWRTLGDGEDNGSQ